METDWISVAPTEELLVYVLQRPLLAVGIIIRLSIGLETDDVKFS